MKSIVVGIIWFVLTIKYCSKGGEMKNNVLIKPMFYVVIRDALSNKWNHYNSVYEP